MALVQVDCPQCGRQITCPSPGAPANPAPRSEKQAKEIERLEQRIRSISDKDLLAMLATASDYRPEAVAIASDEKSRRTLEEPATPLSRAVHAEVRAHDRREEERRENSAAWAAFVPSLLICGVVALPLLVLISPLLPAHRSSTHGASMVGVIGLSIFIYVWSMVTRWFNRRTDTKGDTRKGPRQGERGT